MGIVQVFFQVAALVLCLARESHALPGTMKVGMLVPSGMLRTEAIAQRLAMDALAPRSHGALMRLRGGMMIYNDPVSGDEMMSDSFPIEIIDDVMLKVETKVIVKGALDVNIGGNAAAGDGEAGAAEDEAIEDEAVRVNDVVDAFNLKSMGSMDKKGVIEWVKGYLKTIKERLDKNDPKRSAVFQEKSAKWVKENLLKNVADFEFYTGPSFNAEGSLAMFIYEGENHFPHCYLFKDGLVSEKC